MTNDKELFVYKDSSHHEHSIALKEDAFTFRHQSKNIKDVSFKGKPTTFLRDCFRRFCKSRASITASIILGFLILLAIILPFALPYDVTGGTTSGMEFLPPKLFPTGTGFWDGTKSYKDIIFDKDTNLPQGDFDESSIVKESIKTYPGTIDNTPNKFATGGYIRIASSGTSGDYVWSDKTFTLSDTTNLTLTYEIQPQIMENYLPVPYYISVAAGENEYFVVKNSRQYGEQTVDVGSFLKEQGVTSLESARIRVGINGIGQEEMIGVFLKSLVLKNGTTTMTDVSMIDANKALLDKTWKYSSGGLSGLAGATITYCSFTYNPYQKAYGNYTFVYSKNDIQDMIDQGLCEYDFAVGESSFKALTDTCPIISVDKQSERTAAGITVIEITATVSRYKQKGFANMPYHIFGTDSQGRDMLKYVFEGLRNSLGLAVVISAICFLCGLIWGAIEGYFGGMVDMTMERIVDVLANIPSIILITICVLHLGQTFSVFMLAMCMTGWIGSAGITRTQFYRFKRREYVLASRSLGASDTRLIVNHILPNAMGTIVTSSVLMIPSVIFTEATIAYLGIGLAGMSSLGVILNNNQNFIGSNQYLLIFPSLVLAIMLICFNLFGNGLRDALNPSLKGSE